MTAVGNSITPDSTTTDRRTGLLPLVLAMLSMLGPFSIDTPFPAFAAMRAQFATSQESMQLIVSVYLLAFAAMSIFHGPLSDALGRKPVMIGGLAGYCLGAIGCALSPNLPVLLLFRVVQGLSAGGSVIVSRTIIRDLYEGARAQQLMSTVAMIFGVAPAIAPIIGGFLVNAGGWPVIFWFLAGWSAAMIAAVVFLLPESHPPHRRVPFRPATLVHGITTVARSAEFQRTSWATAFAFGGQFLYIGSAAIFVVDLLHKGDTDFWMFFVPMIGSMIAGNFIGGRLAGRLSRNRLIGYGLLTALGAGVLGVALATLPSADTVPQAIISPSLLAFGVGLAYPTMQLTILDLFPAARGSAASGSMFISLVLNAITATALSPLITRSVLGLALGALALEIAAVACWFAHIRAARHAAVRHPRVELDHSRHRGVPSEPE